MKKKIDYGEHREIDPEKFPSLSNVASVNECTGLMPTPPENQEEELSYQQLSSMEIPRVEPEEEKRGRPFQKGKNKV